MSSLESMRLDALTTAHRLVSVLEHDGQDLGRIRDAVGDVDNFCRYYLERLAWSDEGHELTQIGPADWRSKDGVEVWRADDGLYEARHPGGATARGHTRGKVLALVHAAAEEMARG